MVSVLAGLVLSETAGATDLSVPSLIVRGAFGCKRAVVASIDGVDTEFELRLRERCSVSGRQLLILVESLCPQRLGRCGGQA